MLGKEYDKPKQERSALNTEIENTQNIKTPEMLTAKYSCVKQDMIWVGVWVILNHFACSWGWVMIPWESIPTAFRELW